MDWADWILGIGAVFGMGAYLYVGSKIFELKLKAMAEGNQTTSRGNRDNERWDGS